MIDGAEGYAGAGRAIYPSDAIYVGSTDNRGRGIFARRDLAAGELIEVCPVIVLGGADEQELLDKTHLFDYYFAWGEHQELAAVALGYGSLFNHSYHANADHVCDVARGQIRIYAHRGIRRGEEITINYGGRPDCPDPVWFDVADEGE
ncbi:SET domain-containing protein [Methanoculleus sp. Wushi-C6]|uniref:SET domain-containing protein n=1 Tax=Methanoculleus caldifontis TaxID=2651577 RepID=A0ABU3X0Q2_9EURY|nr:SET domain-containing protein [Methanoculleus sp. Wushi-C6]MDV2481628.1 SET domain-containing protein [Methanoculleus sp. Wushi-C6]